MVGMKSNNYAVGDALIRTDAQFKEAVDLATWKVLDAITSSCRA